MVGLGKSTIYSRVAEGAFPDRYDLGGGVIRSRYGDIDDWRKSRPASAGSGRRHEAPVPTDALDQRGAVGYAGLADDPPRQTMARDKAPFTEVGVRRAVKGVQSAGLPVRGVEILPDETIRVIIGEPGAGEPWAAGNEVNPWDEVLPK